MPNYVAICGGNRTVEFSKDSDMSAAIYAEENHAPVIQLYRLDRVPVARPSKAQIERHKRLIAAANNLATNGR